MDLGATIQNRFQPVAAGDPEPPLLRMEVSVEYATGHSVLRSAAVTVRRGEVVGLVGASGSGKSTLAMTIPRLLSLKGGRVSGFVEFGGADLMRLSENELRRLRGKEIALVPQSPLSALNPALTIGAQLREAWRAHSRSPEWKARAFELLSNVSLPADDRFLAHYPRQLSVGMAQRVLIAMAVLHGPKLLIADEPTSALDVITQADILSLFLMLNREWNMALLCISHDLLSVASLCHRIAILEKGEIVECATPEMLFHSPRHPYTRRLIEAIPKRPDSWREAVITELR